MWRILLYAVSDSFMSFQSSCSHFSTCLSSGLWGLLGSLVWYWVEGVLTGTLELFLISKEMLLMIYRWR